MRRVTSIGGRFIARSARALTWIALIAGATSIARPAFAQTPIEAGYRDFNYGTSVNATPTGEKPQSKVWWNDGFWWGILWDPTSPARYEIHKFNVGTQSWTSTNVAADTRANNKADALWDGTNLFLVFHRFAVDAGGPDLSNPARLYRYSYNAATDTYTLDPGFSVSINGSAAEALVVAKDGTGQLWITWTQQGDVMVNHSIGTDHLSWGTPTRLAVQGNDADLDDISSIIALPGRIGVFWSNQDDDADYFAVHLDGAADNVWQPRETALDDGGPAVADDHMNMVSDAAGNLYVIVKTNLNVVQTDPLIYLLKRTTAGVWSRYVVGTTADDHTRPIIQLDDAGNLYALMTYNPGGPPPGNRELIYRKTTNVSNIQFPTGLGIPFISGLTDIEINNASGTKQVLTSASGLFVIACEDNDRFYFHNHLPVGGGSGPFIASFLPVSGIVGTQVTITGSGFTGATSVTFNGVNAPGFIVDNASQIQVNVPVAATTGPLRVTTPLGTGVSSTNFTIQAIPTVASFLPTSGPSGTEVTVTGTSFLGTTLVRFNGLSATFTVDNNTSLRANVPVTATTGPIAVTNSAGTGTSASNFTVTAPPAPTVASFLPTSGPPGTEVTVTGSAFTGTTLVRFNGVSATFIVDNNTQLRATVPAGATTGPIAVTNGVGTGTSASNFTVTAPPPVVTFSPIADARVEAANPATNYGSGTGNQVLLRVRTSPEIDSYLKFNVTGLSGPVVDAKLRLFCIDDSNDGGRIHAVSNNDLGTSTPWTETGLIWNNAPGMAGPILDQKFNVTINTWVEFNVTSAITGNGTFSLGLSSEVTGIAGYNSKEAATNRPELVITTAAGAPTIANFNPTSGPPGTQVTVTGTNYLTVNAVAFNGVPAASFTVDNATQLRATVPAAASSGPIGITNPIATTFSATSFTVDPPTISNFSPTSGPVGATVVITGTQFSTVSSVRFNGVAATTFVIDNATQITATVPSGATTGAISVLNPAGSASSATNFTVILPPTITTFNPTSGPSGTQVMVTGTNFIGTTAVTFNSIAASSFTVDSPTQLRANVPNGTTTGPIGVTNLAGTAFSATNFTVVKYTLNVALVGSGSVVRVPDQPSYDNGTTVQLTATPAVGWTFTNWTGDASGTANPVNVLMNGNKNVTATFTINTYTLAVSVVGSGSVARLPDQPTYDHGTNVELTATPAVGWTFTGWSDAVTGTANPSNLLMDGNKTVTATFAINTYTLAYTAGPNGTITGTTPQVVNHGSSGTLVTAVPDVGYSFVSWSDGVLTAARTEANVTADVSVTASFAINTYTLTYTAGAGGTVEGTTPQVVAHGADGTAVTAAPNTGFSFVSWSDGVLTALRTETNVTADVSVTASFAINTYTLTYTAGSNGTISGTSPQVVAQGGSGTAVTAVPNIGYSFVSWSDGVLTAARTETNVTADVSVTASFTINTYTLSYAAGPNGTITGITPQVVNHGANGTAVTAVPNTGYSFVSWSDGVLTASRTETNVTADVTVSASFAINTYTLTYTAGTGGTISGTTPQNVAEGADGAEVTAVPDVGYLFVSWSDGVLTASRTETNVTADVSVTASFAIKTYTLTYTAGANGTISGTTPQTVDHGADGSEVTAVADANYHFVSWSDGVLTALRTETNVTADVTVTASFAINTYTLTYTAGTGGTISGTTPQIVNHGADGSEVTATPNTGFSFVSWSDGVLTAARTEINVTANVTVTANFLINTYTLTYTSGANGTISGTTPQTVDHGADGAAVTAMPDVGYQFVSWSDGVLTAARTETNVTADVTVTASFAISTYTLTYTAGANGTLEGTSPQTVDHGADGSEVTAVADANYHFVSWSDGVLTAARTDLGVTADINVTASFAIDTYTLTYTAGAGGTISGVTPQTIDHGADGTPVTAVPDIGYSFVSWSDGVLTAPRTETNVTADVTVSASFAINTYTLSYTAGPNGTISGTTPQIVDHGADGAAVTAMPDVGYQFVSWSDGVLTAARTETNVTADVTVTASFAVNTYTLSYTAGANGTISGTSPQIVGEGGSGTAVTAVPNTGYSFVSWSDGVLTASRTETNVTADVTVTASFAINTYTLTYTAGANGTIEGTSPQTVDHGADGSEVTAVADANYHFVSWSDGVLTASRTETNVTADVTVSASFAINTYTLTYTAGAGGTVEGTTPQVVAHGADGTTVTAAPNTGYSFVSWSDGVLTALRTETNVTADVTVSASFAINTYTLTYTAGANGTISGTTPQVVAQGGSGTAVTAVANTGYSFVSWSDGVLTAARTETNVTADVTVSASFAINTYTLTYTAGANGTISGTTPQVVAHGGSGTAVTAVPNTGYSFVSWSDGVLTASRTETNVTADVTVSASFAINTYTLTYTAGANGTISGTTPQVVAQGGSGTAVTAVANTGYSFVSWSDGVLTASRTETNVTADVTVSASFAINTYTLTYTAGANGTISGTTPQVVAHGGSGTAVTAVPNTGYSFVSWSDGVLTAARTETNVTADISVSASFAINTYTLTYTAGANGTISGTTPQVVAHGGNGTAVTAVPNTGFSFVSWSDGVLTASRTETNVTADVTVSASFAINTYTLTYTAGANGTISGTTPQVVAQGGSGTAVTAVANTGFSFVSWSDGVLTASRTETNVTADVTVSASFAINTYTLTYTAGANGTISGTTPQVVAHGGSGTAVTAVPNTGYSFVSWSDGVLTAARTETNVTADVTVSASFAINTYTLTYTAGAGGTVEGTTPQVVAHGADGTTVTAAPNTGFSFVSWSDGVLTALRTETNVTADVTVSASFAINTYTLTYTAGANGTISGTTPQVVAQGGSGTAVTAVANTGFSFVSWSDGVLTASRTETNVTADVTVSASFAINTYTLTYTAGAGGTVEGTTPQVVAHGADGTTVTAAPNTGFSFVSWSDGVLTAARTETNVTADVSVTATFTANAFTLDVTIVGSGTVSKAPDQATYTPGTNVDLTASPAVGWSFVGWSEDASGSNNPLALLMDGNKAVTATFALNQLLTFGPQADARVQSNAPTTNYGSGTGTNPLLRVRSTGPTINSYLKFVVTGIGGAVTSAKVRLFCIDDSNDGGRIYAVSNNYLATSTPWLEGGLNWNNAPALSGTPLAQKGAVVLNTWVEFDVTSAVTGDGTYSFGIASSLTNIAGYNSKEGTNPPELLIQSGGGGTPTTFPLAVNVVGSGTVAKSPDQPLYDQGTIVQLTANPAVGWNFTGWSGDATGITNPVNVTMNGPKSVTATFATSVYTLGVTVVGSGTVSKAPDQATYNPGTTVSLTANPAVGWSFVGWSGDASGTTNPVNVTMNSNKAVIATFALSGGQVTFNPQADGRVQSDAPTTNYGSGTGNAALLRVRSTGPTINSYLKFEVPALGGPVISARVRVFCVDASVDGGRIHAVSNNYVATSTPWLENGLNWNNAPAIAGSPLAQQGAVALNAWVEFDVTSAVTGVGTYSFAISSAATNIAGYNSKEGANPPQLVIDVGSGAAPSIASGTSDTGPTGTLALGPATPNPFRGQMTLRLDLPRQERVRLEIFDVMGRRVRVLAEGSLEPGAHEFSWDARNDAGMRVESGIYLIQLETPGFTARRKAILVR